MEPDIPKFSFRDKLTVTLGGGARKFMKSKTKTDIESQSKTKSKTQSKTKFKSKTDIESKSKSKTDIESKSKTDI